MIKIIRVHKVAQIQACILPLAAWAFLRIRAQCPVKALEYVTTEISVLTNFTVPTFQHALTPGFWALL